LKSFIDSLKCLIFVAIPKICLFPFLVENKVIGSFVFEFVDSIIKSDRFLIISSSEESSPLAVVGGINKEFPHLDHIYIEFPLDIINKLCQNPNKF
jgi:hypothetical protein